MADKKYFFVLLFGMLLAAKHLAAQIPANSAATNAAQRITFSGGEYALRYEVVIEKEVRKKYISHLREFTTEKYLEVSLKPGKYRFQVIPYDLLNRPSEASEWKHIKVLKSLKLVTETELKPLEKRTTRLGAAWSPSLPIYGEDYENNNSFAGANARVGMIFDNPFDIHIGPELAASLYVFETTGKFAGAVDIGINFLAMKWLDDQKFALALRFGAAWTSFAESQNPITSNVGASFHWRLNNKFLLETGFDYSNMFNDIQGGSLRPWIGAGMQF